MFSSSSGTRENEVKLTEISLQTSCGHIDGSPLLLLKFCPQLLSKLLELPSHHRESMVKTLEQPMIKTDSGQIHNASSMNKPENHLSNAKYKTKIVLFIS
jgi:hypothetical protein